jgi:hypothetical protein
VNFSEFQKPTNVDFTLFAKTVINVLQQFEGLSDSKIIEEIKNVEHRLLIEDVIRQGKVFRELVQELAQAIDVMSAYMKSYKE